MLEQLDITTAFDRQIRVPAVQDTREMAAVLSASGAFESPADVNEVLNRVREYSNSDKVCVGIKTILTTAETARLSAEPVEWFAEQIAGQIARYSPYAGGGN